MSLSLHTIQPKQGSKKDKKRVGRGLASKGTYSGRGVKGQRARSGGRAGLKLFGIRKIMLSTPKLRGFNVAKEKAQALNLDVLSAHFPEGSKISPQQLAVKGLIAKASVMVKILGTGTARKWVVKDCLVSASAKEKIEKAGGTILASK